MEVGTSAFFHTATEGVEPFSVSTVDYTTEDRESTTLYVEPDLADKSGAGTSIINPYWYPGPYFYPVHIVAITSLVISIIASLGVLIHQGFNHTGSFWNRPAGERLVVYLAICDLLFSGSHLADHSSMIALRWYPIPMACEALGFLTVTFIVAQQMLIVYIAVNSLLVVGFHRKVNLGRYDWRLLSFAFVIPFSFNCVGLGLRWFGAGSIWCLVNLARPGGMMISQGYSVFTMVTFITCGVIYAVVWLKISRDVKSTSYNDTSRFSRTAKIMSVCVLASMFQWTPGFIQTVWRMRGVPHPFFVMATVFNTNVGGLLNCFAYTFIRKRSPGGQED